MARGIFQSSSFFAELLNRRAPGEPARSYDLRQRLPPRKAVHTPYFQRGALNFRKIFRRRRARTGGETSVRTRDPALCDFFA